MPAACSPQDLFWKAGDHQDIRHPSLATFPPSMLPSFQQPYTTGGLSSVWGVLLKPNLPGLGWYTLPENLAANIIRNNLKNIQNKVKWQTVISYDRNLSMCVEFLAFIRSKKVQEGKLKGVRKNKDQKQTAVLWTYMAEGIRKSEPKNMHTMWLLRNSHMVNMQIDHPVSKQQGFALLRNSH